MTRGQARALKEDARRYLVTAEDLPARLNPKRGPVGIEIGFGMGHSFGDWAAAQPDWLLVGIELYQPGIGACVNRLVSEDLHNALIVEAPAQEVLQRLGRGVADEIRIFFPDPWPKKRHHKRRLIQPEFLDQLADVVVAQGVVRLATDWAPYADWIESCFAQSVNFRPGGVETVRNTTRFENRGLKLGHAIRDFVFVRSDETAQH